MAIDFPNSPVAGTVFGAWRYDGIKWGAVSGVSGGGSAGDITAVLAGAGLSGGGTEGDVSLALVVPVTVARGGTNATDAATALSNLGGAPLASPVFTGDPKAPTPATADNDTSVATTAYVKAQGYQTGNQMITVSGDASGSGTTAIPLTLATVNANVGTFQGITVNAKGLVTAAANQSYLTSPVNLTSQVTGVLPIANGGSGSSTAAAAPWVETAGDSMTGDLTINKVTPVLTLTKTASGQAAFLSGNLNATVRWQIIFGNATAETGSNAGSNFSIDRFNDAGTYIDSPFTISRASGSVGFGTSGALTSDATYATLKQGSTNGLIVGTGGDPANYARNTTHFFQTLDGSSSFARFSAANGTTNISGAWTTFSDVAAKENIEPYTTGLDALVALQPITFTYRAEMPFGDDGRARIGLIAQEVAPHVPEIVGRSDELMTLEPGNLIYCLINSIKELAARVALLEGK